MYDAPIQGSILADDLNGLIPCRISDAASTLYMNYTQPEVHVKLKDQSYYGIPRSNPII
ncbi:hypothetical protein SNOG_12014 [Parastagonospora nodorum SN15]|uniref:Uncharacterized protein n=1 Tax=Phaeosphaeria nodorum (strain SN15 / ATCC MYA-4574 / FGSC 10173) TaxID=321614 RepID=Q0U8A0_PHANO|nr:hypothetical protein SNOG_12014 [Parastagonospora nodorum SN15]EAT80426.1 hypothetical protein SNOG_12014 [Parastagonospora nodorum SN15]